MTTFQMADAVFLGNMKTILALMFCVASTYWIMYTIEMITEWQFNRKMKKMKKDQEKKDAS
jgi:uncharacterized membrane protein